ncbi:hypothetical protein B0T25DRAFT_545569 [Lasiosphaeria hispida]|uniref:Azaphilone pigments biosynthesis cluster protein L N-terminal domain-containing protein n=1 Tax=Lasiosphaeria hispida TaxID=260671 RepID=A0AAJ0HK38_9PEZI|nr:hypothetical protein B0T25DRAFT_545569 [Lasiosphaeria hispida]
MDPFSLSVSILAVIGAAIKTSKAISDFTQSARDAPTELAATALELDNLTKALELLRSHCKDDRVSMQRPAPLWLVRLDSVLKSCEEVISDLDKLVAEYRSRRIQYAMSGKDKLKALDAKLAAHTKILQTVLGISTLKLAQATKNDTSTLLDDSQQIKGLIAQVLEEVVGLRAMPRMLQGEPQGSAYAAIADQREGTIIEEYMDDIASYAETVVGDMEWGGNESAAVVVTANDMQWNKARAALNVPDASTPRRTPSPYQKMAPRPASAPLAQQEMRPLPVTFDSAPASTRAPIPSPQLFYTLKDSPEHILPDANSYWRYLTPAAYTVYERIYEDCKSNDGSGWVYYPKFTAQFNPTTTPPSTIKSTWTRLLREPSTDIFNSRHPRGLAMATLYMLHLERFRPHLRPLDEEREVGVSRARRPLLKGFGHWVPCGCGARGCAVEWNFVNDVGLHRGGRPASCVLAKFVGRGGRLGFLSSGRRERDARERTVQAWLEGLEGVE